MLYTYNVEHEKNNFKKKKIRTNFDSKLYVRTCCVYKNMLAVVAQFGRKNNGVYN